MLKDWMQKNKLTDDFKKKVIQFAFFLSISTIIWFLTAFEDDYTENISYPVEYINLPKDKVELMPLPTSLNLNVTTSGYNLINYYLDANIPPLQIDYQKEKIGHLPNQYDYLLTKNFRNTISKSFNSTDIHNITPDTLKFYLFDIKSKKVPVCPLLKYALKEGYVLKKALFCYPDSVLIEGAEQDINQIDSVVTGVVSLGLIDQDVKRNLALKKIKNVTFSKERANIKLSIEQATEKQIEVPLQVLNGENKPLLQLIPNNIHLKFKVGLSRYHQIDAASFSFYVDYPNKDSDMLEVKIKEQPSDIYDLEFGPRHVEYLLIDND